MIELIVFDMDGVLVDAHSSWSWVHDHFCVNNEDSLQAYLEGEIDDREFIRRDIALWRACKANITRGDIIEILDDVPLMKGFEKTMGILKSEGYSLAVISGGIKPLADSISKGYFDRVMANDIIDDERVGLTGGALEVRLNDKGHSFDLLMDELDISPHRCAAVGNSFIDAPMLKKAALGIAFDPDDETVKGSADVIIKEKNLWRVYEEVEAYNEGFIC